MAASQNSSKPYRKRYGGTWNRGKVPGRVGIENRPAVVDEKSRIGDWEADTIVGRNQKSALLTLVERVTRYTIFAASVPDKYAGFGMNRTTGQEKHLAMKRQVFYS